MHLYSVSAHPLTSLGRISEVLRIYEEIRLPFAPSLANLSFSTGSMYVFDVPGYYDGTRKVDVGANGIGAYERESMATILKREIWRRWDSVESSRDPLATWKEAESKLQALAHAVLPLDCV
ncbi:hypothetical protein JVU11DRAFT_9866 [Chiua virens]|nr:hypothetical protein JVU11DRAFT_9866 [Chiua virens]